MPRECPRCDAQCERDWCTTCRTESVISPFGIILLALHVGDYLHRVTDGGWEIV